MRLRLILALLVAWGWLGSLPARAESGEFPRLLRDLREGFLSQPALVAEEGTDDAESRREAAGALDRVVLAPALADPALGALDPAVQMDEVARARGHALSAFPVLDLGQCYAEAGGDPKRFLQVLRAVARTRRLNLDWTSPAVLRAVARVHGSLRALAELNFHVAWSGRSEGEGWTGDVRVAWYPLQGEVHLFLVASSDCSSGIRSALLNLSGPVRWPAGQEGSVRSARLAETTYEIRRCEYRLVGSWTEPPLVGTLRPGEVVVASQLNLRTLGRSVEGRLVQEVRGQLASGEVLRGRVVYLLEGRLGEAGRMQGTFQASGDRETLIRLLGRSAETEAGTWTGRLEGQEASGTLRAGAGPERSWRARVLQQRTTEGLAP